MPALVTDIAAGIRAAQIETVSDAAIQARYPSARDGSEDPAEGLFDAAADAVTALNARKALLGVERRRFRAVAGELVWLDPAAGLPSVALIDPEQALAATGLISRIELDLDDETTTFEVFC